MRHWMVGEPRLCLFVALKDWPHHYYNGQYRRQFNSLYYQQSVIGKEFINMYIRSFFVLPSLTMTVHSHSLTLSPML